MILMMASVHSERKPEPVVMIRPMPQRCAELALPSTLWARAFARCDLAPFREFQNDTHFGSARTDAADD